MLNSIINKPNTIIEQQRLAQADVRPIYYRLPRAKLYVNSFYTLFAVTMATTAYGISELIKGKPT